MKKRFLSVFVAILMVLTLMPTTVLAAETTYDIWVNGVQVTSRNAADVLGTEDTGATVTYNASTNSLTLNNARITKVYADDDGYDNGIYSESSLNLILKGENSIILDTNYNTCGMCIYGDLTISGDGNLNVRTVENQGYNYGIYVAGDITVNGGKLSVESRGSVYYDCIGICAHAVTVNKGSVKAVAGDAGDDAESSGIVSDCLTVSGGVVEGVSNADSVYYANGIFLITYEEGTNIGNLVVTGSGKVIARCDSSANNEDDSAIWAYGGIRISDEHKVTGAQEIYEAGIVELKQAVAGTSVVIQNDNALPFIDINVNDWFYNAVFWAVENNITTGTGDGTTFSPYVTTSRAMIVTMLYRLEGSPDVELTTQFKDVAENAWYAKAVSWAFKEGVTQGTGDGTTFSPDNPITREQLAKMLYSYAGIENYAPAIDLAANFPDANKVSSWAKKELTWAVEVGLITGKASGNVTTLSPLDQATRAEAVTIFQRFCEKGFDK